MFFYLLSFDFFGLTAADIYDFFSN